MYKFNRTLIFVLFIVFTGYVGEASGESSMFRIESMSMLSGVDSTVSNIEHRVSGIDSTVSSIESTPSISDIESTLSDVEYRLPINKNRR